MKTTVLPCLVLSLLFAPTGCSHKGVYQDLQRNKRNECMQAPQSEYYRCMRDMEQSYEDYERQRQEALKQDLQPKQE